MCGLKTPASETRPAAAVAAAVRALKPPSRLLTNDIGPSSNSRNNRPGRPVCSRQPFWRARAHASARLHPPGCRKEIFPTVGDFSIAPLACGVAVLDAGRDINPVLRGAE